MRSVLLLSSFLLSLEAFAGQISTPTRTVPEPEMWALLGIVAIAIGASRFIGRK